MLIWVLNSTYLNLKKFFHCTKKLLRIFALVGDNFSVKKLLQVVDISPIECTSPKLDIAIEQWVGKEKGLCNELQVFCNLIEKLQTIRNSAKVRALTHLGTKRPIETRWTAKLKMLCRYVHIKEDIK